jgi:beta-lactam-binding protein with PASTA domain
MGRRVNPVPNLRGSSIRAARIIAEQNGYELGKITEIPSADEDEKVIAQYPIPEASGNFSDQIDVVLTRHRPKTYIMPDITGQNLNRAILFFEEKGFEVTIHYRRHRNVRRGNVVRQFPEPGYMLKEDQNIILEVAR